MKWLSRLIGVNAPSGGPDLEVQMQQNYREDREDYMRRGQDFGGKRRPQWDTGGGSFLRELGKRFLIWTGIAVGFYLLVLLYQAVF